ncbi:Na+/H+ antiporter NhaA [Poseidonibacter ostreae]|jgi:Na+:H+ antiporter, NhaA family|uniref:Na(+)/H(+) antiporter NhaA n=1 Tax=Poseidonibacter ostreae TaxID=2654171 RepID=A0A6L4WPW8_9BACT|nr:Na+/H+ antiporter NhaA [Poseidonibacter ostreae]KAB7884577.1 Na+/H+ antiporter NhaA [Poseidonibacter ostreae]KAB7885687.1 Na+/H+ antiporter NhaA [Poseidonibacter ostreae]KAB7890392.1 Na+/H+ antiporter NhaA [Poseidonibacter ostreae]MAC83224.1 Na+/H+ antiporter NhaA [Arcobacter sp.]|tara:strand:- start:8701 stop:10035 length:1335 start_codon:yes stop_codon:yes gene_type:complete
MKIYAPWEKAFRRIATPFEHFIHAQTTTGLILVFMTILALILANSTLSESYLHFFHVNIDFNVGSWALSHSLHHWINDGLMAIFFFLIGLEIKREITAGELSNLKVAMLPILAAIGGMVFPAVIYLYFNTGAQGANGWGIPMATDIAFAISALVLLGKRVPTALVTFLVALAIVDDLGAVLVIALFYTETINMLPLGLAGAMFFIMIVLNRFGIHAILPYFVVGLFMWFFMLESGVHATIAGVLAALTIPSKPKRAPASFSKDTKNLIEEYEKYPIQENHMIDENQKAILLNIKDKIDEIGTPAARLEHSLHLPVALIIIPLFALANAGIAIDFSSIGSTVLQPVSIGIIAGLVLGKVIGIFGISWLAIKLKIAQLPSGSTMSQIFGVSFLGGIGFTMSIFVADLAFINSPELIFQAKVGILCASLFAGLFGFFWLKYIAKKVS